MNILYIGNYRDHPGGWSNASEMWVRVLNKAYPDTLAIRYFNYSQKRRKLSSLYDELEKKSFDKYDVVIQNVLPPDMEKINDAYNIGICYFESTGVLGNGFNNWEEKIYQMDEMWMTTDREIKEFGSLNVKVLKIPQSIDLWSYKKTVKNLLPQEDVYRFYSIGIDSSPRKNPFELVYAYFYAFDDTDKVQLILKTGPQNIIHQVIAEAKKKIPKAKYPPILVIPQDLDENDMIALHKDCDCYISTSSEESLSRPLMDACAMEKLCLVTDQTSMCELVPEGFRINSSKIPCIVPQAPVQGIYTYKEHWYKPSILSLAEMMESVFRKGMKGLPNPLIGEYDFKHVAGLAKERFSSIYENA